MKSTKTFLVLSLLAAACGEVTSGDGGDAPTISAVSPDRGGLPGGTSATVTGTGFVDGVDAELGNRVIVGGREATDVDAVDDATLTFTVPPGPAEGATVDVIVFNSNGFAVASDAITYNAQPLVTGISLQHDGQAGGASVTMTGRGFEEFSPGDTSVTVGGSTSTEIEIVSDTELTFVVPAKAADDGFFARLDVTLSNANGTSTLPGAFAYAKPGFVAVAAREFPNGIYHVDPETFALTRIAASDQRISSLVLVGDELFGLKGSCCSRLFGTLDALTGQFAEIGGNNAATSELAEIAGRFFAYGRTDNRFLSIDATTGVATQVGGPLGLTGSTRGALAARDGATVFLIPDLNGQIRIVDVATGGVSLGPTMNGPAVLPHTALAIDAETLHVIGHQQSSTSSLFSVDVNTGEVTLLHEFDRNITALAPTPPSFE